MSKWIVVGLFLATTGWAEVPVESPVPLRVVVSTSEGAAPLLPADVARWPHRTVVIDRSNGPDRQTLSLEVERLRDGRLWVRAQWFDATSEGSWVKWEPSVVVDRKTRAFARLDFPGGTRVLTLTVD